MKQKIWIFIIENELGVKELESLYKDCLLFVQQWESHAAPVNASVELYKNRLLIFRNDEEFNPIGGCATDNLFRFIQELEKKYSTHLLNRRLVVYEKEGNIQVKNLSDVTQLIQSGEIDDNTIIYNTSIISSDEWQQFRLPAKDSWLKMFFESFV
ncbi:MAG: hypothetical protein OHK0036_04100 [Bacteroidia bacterium]